MKPLKTTVLICICGSVAFVVAAARQDERPQVIERLLSKDPVQVKQAQEELLSARRALTAQLKRIVEDPNNRAYRAPSVEAAMVILGEMRALEAVDILVEYIGWPYVQKADEPRHSWEIDSRARVTTLASFRRWPSVAALVRIGEPSVAPIFRKLVATRGELELKAYLSVLIWLCDREYLLSRLNQLVAQATDPDQRVRLEQAVRLVTDEPPVNEKAPQWRRR